MIDYKKLGVTKEEAVDIMARRSTVMLNVDWLPTLAKISGDTPAGEVINAIYKFCRTLDVTEPEGMQASLVFSMILPTLESYAAQYLETSAKNTANINKRWAKERREAEEKEEEPEQEEDTTVYDGIRPYTNEYDPIQPNTNDTSEYDLYPYHSYQLISPHIISDQSNSLINKSVEQKLHEVEEEDTPVISNPPPDLFDQTDFDYGVLVEMIKKVITSWGAETNGLWRERDYINVFVFYTQVYKHHMQQDHPRISLKNLEKIMMELPGTVDSFHGQDIELEPEDYTNDAGLIELYFNTENFNESNRNINHFMSGQIRANLFHTMKYREEESG